MIMMPGTPRGATARRLSAKGPRGQIIAQTYNQKTMWVMFKADQLLTSLEVIRNDNATG
jgi:hypothetical protein